MSQFQFFDSVQLVEPVPLEGETFALEGMTRAIVETVYPHQIQLLVTAWDVTGGRSSLGVLASELSDDLVAEVLDFAEFLTQRRQKPLSADG